jgi:hypothetical protein
MNWIGIGVVYSSIETKVKARFQSRELRVRRRLETLGNVAFVFETARYLFSKSVQQAQFVSRPTVMCMHTHVRAGAPNGIIAVKVSFLIGCHEVLV